MSAINVDRVPREQLAKLKDPLHLASLLFCVFLFAVLLYATGNTILTWSVFAVCSILASSEVLTLAMPRSVRARSVANCVRGDGSWSSGRASVEKHALSRLRRNLVYVMRLCAIPSMFGLWVFNREVIPIGLGVEALASVSSDPDQWKSALREEEQRFDRWQKSSTLASSVDVSQHKRALWESWPIVVLGGVLWLVLVFTVVAKYYIYCIRKFRQSVCSRANDYRWRDLSRTPPFSNPNSGSRRERRKASKFA